MNLSLCLEIIEGKCLSFELLMILPKLLLLLVRGPAPLSFELPMLLEDLVLFLLGLWLSYPRRAWHRSSELLCLAFLISSEVLDACLPSTLTMLIQSYWLLRLWFSDMDVVLSRSFTYGFKKRVPALCILVLAFRLLTFPDAYAFRICPLRGGSWTLRLTNFFLILTTSAWVKASCLLAFYWANNLSHVWLEFDWKDGSYFIASRFAFMSSSSPWCALLVALWWACLTSFGRPIST